ncbi:MAG: TIGR02117 family protein [Calditrichaeota bacterium]|nr:MAG: TIGR02117 family protein [Calditrichota bacterium]
MYIFFWQISILLLWLISFSNQRLDTPQHLIASGKAFKIFVVNHGWHTGIIIPARDINLRIPQIEQTFSDASFLEFGWGDEGFYRSQKFSVRLALRSLFWPTKSVLHVVGIPVSPEKYFAKDRLFSLSVSQSDYNQLLVFIEKSFQRDENNAVENLGKGIYGHSYFYKATGKYHLFNTCNTWSAKALKNSGLKIYPALNLTAGSVVESIKRVEEKPDDQK